MTQTELTTEDRIYRIILDSETYGKATYIIAAEIDALTSDNAQANQWLVNGVGKIAGLEAQLAEAQAALATRTDERDAALGLIKSHHDARNEARRELAEARAQIAALTAIADKWRMLPEDVQIDAEVSAAARAREVKE